MLECRCMAHRKTCCWIGGCQKRMRGSTSGDSFGLRRHDIPACCLWDLFNIQDMDLKIVVRLLSSHMRHTTKWDNTRTQSLSSTFEICHYSRPLMYKPIHLLRPYMLQLLIRPQEVVRICFRENLPLIGLLHKVFITLLFRKSNRIFLRLEIEMCSLHKVCR